MKYFFPLFICILLISNLLLPRSNALAKSMMYVAETNWVNVRSGPSVENRIIAMVKSGQPIEVLGQEEDWYYVRTPKNEEGWMAKSLLTEQKPLAEQLEILTRKTEEQSRLVAKLSEENNSLKEYVKLFESNEIELKRLRNENLRLKNRQDQFWAAVGAGILFLGWIIGLITGTFYRKGKSKYRYVVD